MESKASTELKKVTTTMDTKYKLLPPSNHRDKNEDRATQTFNNHFILGL